jgi:predicted Zn-dependent protease
MREMIEKILADPRYQTNIEYGEPRPGHPEGKVKVHIADLESNLEQLTRRGISSEEYWKLKFIIHVHDTFKAEAEQHVPIRYSLSHASLAREYASQYTDDQDLLNIIQFHDKGYSLWLDYSKNGSYNPLSFQRLLDTIKDWDLFLMFTIVDGRTKGKDISKLIWFINEVKKFKTTRVDPSWVDPV